jgi:hypothetical protein
VVKVLLKPKLNVEGLSPRPLVMPSTAAVGLGLPGKSLTICGLHDTVPRLPSVVDPFSPRNRFVMVTVLDVVTSVTRPQLGPKTHPVVTSGSVERVVNPPSI